MGKIIEASELPEKDKVYLKKDIFGWRTVEPNVINGKLQWSNILFGGKRNLMFLIFVMIICGLLYLGTTEIIGVYKEVAETPCDFCEDCHAQTRRVISSLHTEIDVDDIDLTGLLGGENG